MITAWRRHCRDGWRAILFSTAQFIFLKDTNNTDIIYIQACTVYVILNNLGLTPPLKDFYIVQERSFWVENKEKNRPQASQFLGGEKKTSDRNDSAVLFVALLLSQVCLQPRWTRVICRSCVVEPWLFSLIKYLKAKLSLHTFISVLTPTALPSLFSLWFLICGKESDSHLKAGKASLMIDSLSHAKRRKDRLIVLSERFTYWGQSEKAGT